METKYIVAVVSPAANSHARSFNSLREAEWHAERLKKDPVIAKIHIRRIGIYENKGRECIEESRLLFTWERKRGGWVGEFQ